MSEDFKKFLEEQGYPDHKIIGDTYIAIYPLIYTHAIIMGKVGDTSSFDDRWCYHNYMGAKVAYENFDGDGEPEGWHRHPFSGRRRDENGKEYVRI